MATAAIGKHVAHKIRPTILARLIRERKQQLDSQPERDEKVMAVLWWIRCTSKTLQKSSRKKRRELNLSPREEVKILLLNLLLVVWQDGSDEAIGAFSDYMDAAFFSSDRPIDISYFQALAHNLGVPPIDQAGAPYTEHKLIVCASILTNLCGGDVRAAKQMVGKHHCARMLQEYNAQHPETLILHPEIELFIARCTQISTFAELRLGVGRRPLYAQEWIPASLGNNTLKASPSGGSSEAPAADGDILQIVCRELEKVLGSQSMEVHAEAARTVDAVCPGFHLESKMKAHVAAKYNAAFPGSKLPVQELVQRESIDNSDLALLTVAEKENEQLSEEQVWEFLDISYIVWNSEDFRQALLASCQEREDEFSMGFMKPLLRTLRGPEKVLTTKYERCCAGLLWKPSDVVVTEILGAGSYGIVTKAHLNNKENEFAMKAEICNLDTKDVLYAARSMASQTTTHGCPYVVKLLGNMMIPIPPEKDKNVKRVILCTFHELCASDLEKKRFRLKDVFDNTKDLFEIIQVMEDCSGGLVQLEKHDVSHRDM